ncbi:hypothetical protein V3W47_11490 [Deinococcus sp. YIM 134068]|uniref:beta strand repeat-containing protein n=1 Tax=Deinococcus lichenicola TaxID=3118910 RepID=UPI002F93862E
MNQRITSTTRPTLTLSAVSLALLLAGCGGGGTAGTPVSSLADSGPGSLREVLAAAQDGDTLRFTAQGTVALTSALTVGKDVTLLTGGVTLDAGGTGRVLEVAGGATVTVKGGTLTGGVGQPIEVAATASRATSQALSQATWGGIVINRGELTLDGTTVTGGRAMNGGGIYNDAGANLTLRNVTLTANEAFIPTPDLENESTGSGGAIANRGTLTVESGTFRGNTAYSTGGVLRNTGTLTVQDGLFEDNACTAPVTAGGSGGCAGGVALLGGSGTSTLRGGTFRDNTATRGGGVLFLSNANVTVTVEGGSFEGNRVTGGTDSGGGAVLSLGRLTVGGGTFRGNTALSGGAFNISGGGTLQLTGGTVEGNTASEYGGGIGVHNAQGALTLGGTAVVRGNRAGIAAGGIDVSGATLTMTGGTVEGNSAGQEGGGITVGNGSVSTISGGVIRGNDGGERGGGLRVYSSGTVTMTGGEVSGNTARTGAGLNISAPTTANPGGTFTLSGGTLSGNTATNGSGGGIYNGAFLTLEGGSVTGNSSTAPGGGIRNRAGASFTRTGGDVSGNTPNDLTSD